MKILSARWGGLTIDAIDVQVQGDVAAGQIVRALTQFNTAARPPEVVVMIRGGGSADDLAAFSTEQVTRAVSTSAIPTLVAIGHEVDVSLAELAADKRASTPSNAAELLTPDKTEVLSRLLERQEHLYNVVTDTIYDIRTIVERYAEQLTSAASGLLAERRLALTVQCQILMALSPQAALRRGYAIIRDQSGGPFGRRAELLQPGVIVNLETEQVDISAQVIKVIKKGQNTYATTKASRDH